jgi:hypothetical protein
VLWTIAECTIGTCCVSVPPMRPLFSKLLPGVFVTRRPSLSPPGMPPPSGSSSKRFTTTACLDTDARRNAYAMRGWSSSEMGGTPTADEENARSQAESVLGREEEQVPASWLASTNPMTSSPRGSAVTTCEEAAGDVVEKPERVLRKG